MVRRASHHRGSPGTWLLALGALAGATLLLLRATQVVTWSWVLVLAPFTAGGVLYVAVKAWLAMRPIIDALRSRGPTAFTAAPEQLEPPLGTDSGDLRILAQHPEILAALCLGFRMLRLQPVVLGRPVTDPWGVYAAALLASPLELEVLKLLARKHAHRYAARGRNALRRTPSDAQVMKQAVRHFQRCAAGSLQGRGNPDCPFEHVTVVFGTRSPNRDAHLKSIAPKVRALLERQYPQLATARLADGSPVKYDEWQKRAVSEQRELTRLRKEQRHLSERVSELESELTTAHGQTDQLRRTLEVVHTEVRAAAQAEHERGVRELRTALDVARHEHARESHRFESEQTRLLATIEALSAERDALERLLFTDIEDDDAPELPADVELAGLRVLLAGGNPGHVPPIKEFIEARGIQLLHEESGAAAQLVAGAHLVVLWTRFMTHATYFSVKRECRVRNVPYCYWVRTAPASLLGIIAQQAPSNAASSRASRENVQP